LSFFYYTYLTHPHLPSFPTRRSSDLPLLCEEGNKLLNTVSLVRFLCSTSSVSLRTSHRPRPYHKHRPDTYRRRGPSPGRRTSCPDRKSTRLNSSHVKISYAVFCLKKK